MSESISATSGGIIMSRSKLSVAICPIPMPPPLMSPAPPWYPNPCKYDCAAVDGFLEIIYSFFVLPAPDMKSFCKF